MSQDENMWFALGMGKQIKRLIERNKYYQETMNS